MSTRADYQAAVRSLQRAYASLPADVPVRLRKKTSNLFRTRTGTTQPLDVSAFAGVIGVDAQRRTAEVLGMTTYEELVAATLRHGLMPLVVPQLKSITLGGAVTGLGIESSSFRNGLPHESVLEMDVLTGTGEVLTVKPGDDLFAGFPNSYGTLGYALRLVIELEPVKAFVHLEHRPVRSYAELATALEQACSEDGNAFVDGVAFDPGEGYVTVGRWSDTAQSVSDYTLTEVFYRSLQTKDEDWLTAADYLWRWDTDWFWCSRVFGVQTRPRLRRLLGRRLLRSTTWYRLVALENTHHVKARLDARKGLPVQEQVVQDVEVPVRRLPEFLAFLDAQTGIRPVWVCPLRPRGDLHFPLYPMAGEDLWVNVGFWSAAPLPPGEADGFHNRRIEAEVTRLGGHKSLYATAFYERDEFARLYGGDVYDVLKKTYDPDGRLLDLHAKTVGRR